MEPRSTELVSRAQRAWESLLTVVSRVGAVVMSSRGLAVMALVGCGVLVIGPWLRPAISRDFRGIHIPWSTSSSSSFLPEYVAEVPRNWSWGSVAMPLLLVIGIGVLVVSIQPRQTSRIFGLLLALSLPALAATLWNHPALVEFFDGEIRERSMLRAVFRQQHEDMLAGGAPDRLAVLGGRSTTADDLSAVHPVVQPFRYLVYGPWLIGVAAAALLLSHPGNWHRRLAYAGQWAAAGLLIAAAVTLPRWVAEYHLAAAELCECSQQFVEAEQSLEQARRTMPELEFTWRYWLAKGRLCYRQERDNEYVNFFLAHQQMLGGDTEHARAILEPSIRGSGGSAVQRDLLAEIIGHSASELVGRGDHSGAETAWGAAAAATPWQPAYRIAHVAAILAAAPNRAAEIEQQLFLQIDQVGDRMVNSDLASLIGDAHFATGNFERAREMYDQSMSMFHLPKYINLHAQEGRLGM